MGTPIRNNYKKHKNLTTVSTPIRRHSRVPLESSVILEPANEEEERNKRRSVVEIQKKLTNISSTSSPSVENIILDEAEIKDHLQICAKLYAENRITQKNAWQLHVIEVVRKIASTNTANVLQIAGSSLDIGAKVYGLRVDDVYAKGLQLASSLSKIKENENSQVDEQIDDTMEQETRKRSSRKKVKKLAADKRATIDREEKGLYAPIKQKESIVFGTKENIDISAVDNLFTHKVPVNPETHQFQLLSKEKYWAGNRDELLEVDEILDIELPDLPYHHVCFSFKDFEIGTWDLDEEENKMLLEATTVPEPVLDENGIPVPELDGSIHDIFAQDDNIADSASDVEEGPEVFQAQIRGEIAHIVDAIPEECRIETDYGYNALVKTSSGKYIERIWAGPSHWKVKFNRRSSARYSGANHVEAVIPKRKKKEVQHIDFLKHEVFDVVDRFVVKRAPPTTTFEKITLPIPELDLSIQNMEKIEREMLTKPRVALPRLIVKNDRSSGYEIEAYNYENPNDSQYCSRHDSDDINDNGPGDNNSFYEELQTQQQFLDDNLVIAPEMVSSNHIPYAMQAKKMDMKKLKVATCKCLEVNENSDSIKPVRFSQLYQTLPQLLTNDMKKELTCPLALVALLHLCNEKNLQLVPDKSGEDFTVIKAVE